MDHVLSDTGVLHEILFGASSRQRDHAGTKTAVMKAKKYSIQQMGFVADVLMQCRAVRYLYFNSVVQHCGCGRLKTRLRPAQLEEHSQTDRHKQKHKHTHTIITHTHIYICGTDL